MDEGHIQPVQPGEEPGDEIALAFVLRLGLDLDGILLGGGDNVLPQGGDAFFQFHGGKAAQIREGVQIQPYQQGLLRQDVLGLGAQALERLPEVLKIGVEGALFRIRPGFAGLFPQVGQQFGIVPGAAELNGIKLGGLVEIQKFIVSPDPGLVGLGRKDTADVAGDPGRAEMPQDADPFVALLHIEITQVFKADDGVGDAGVSQMGGAQADPFGGEFGFHIQQWPKRSGKGGDPPAGLHAGDPLRGDFHQAHIYHGIGGVFRQQFIQHGRVGRAAGHQQLPVFLLPEAHGLDIFIGCCLGVHSYLQGKVFFTYIIPQFCEFATKKIENLPFCGKIPQRRCRQRRSLLWGNRKKPPRTRFFASGAGTRLLV